MVMDVRFLREKNTNRQISCPMMKTTILGNLTQMLSIHSNDALQHQEQVIIAKVLLNWEIQDYVGYYE